MVKMKKLTLSVLGLFFVLCVGGAQEDYSSYYGHDVDQLLKFLKQEKTLENRTINNGDILISPKWQEIDLLTCLQDLENNGYFVWNKTSDVYRIEVIEIPYDFSVNAIYENLVGYLDFSGCEALTKVVCPKQEIDSVSFENCSELLRVTLPYNKIKSANFKNCTLTHLQINNNQLLPSQIKLTAKPRDYFKFGSQEVYGWIDPDVCIRKDEIYLKIDLTDEARTGFVKTYCWVGVVPDYDTNNTNIYYVKLEDIQKLSTKLPLPVK